MAAAEHHTEEDFEAQVARIFVTRECGIWSDADQSRLQMRLETDPVFAQTWRRVERSWFSIGSYATSPELMACRQQAIARLRRANAHRWRDIDSIRRRMIGIAAAVVIAAVAAALQLSGHGFARGDYRTEVGEQRVVELQDRSLMTLDSKTRVRVRFSDDARIVELMGGQAQFSVARDPERPFKVQVGDHTIVALGTVFTVEYVDREVRVAMIEGRTAIVPDRPAPAIVELAAGEELRIHRNGRSDLNPRADLEAATAWRQGKIVFNRESLGEAVRRLNRYSRTQLVVGDPALAATRVSGVFEIGDLDAFVEAIQLYLPVRVVAMDSGVIRLEGE